MCGDSRRVRAAAGRVRRVLQERQQHCAEEDCSRQDQTHLLFAAAEDRLVVLFGVRGVLELDRPVQGRLREEIGEESGEQAGEQTGGEAPTEVSQDQSYRLVAGDAEHVPSVVEELVQVVLRARCFPYEGREQGAVIEENGEERESDERQPDGERGLPQSPVHRDLLLGVLAPVGLIAGGGPVSWLPDLRSPSSLPARLRR